MAERVKARALLLQVGLMPFRILVSARRGKKVSSIGKPLAPNSVPCFPTHRWKTSDVKLNCGWKNTEPKKKEKKDI